MSPYSTSSWRMSSRILCALGTEGHVWRLARLIGAAELQAAAHHTGALTVGAIMSTKLITLKAKTDLGEVADLFRRHRFISLPVVDDEQRFLGIIFQMHLILGQGRMHFALIGGSCPHCAGSSTPGETSP